jgi:formylglycine-generating enzyme required for sulfatase activity
MASTTPAFKLGQPHLQLAMACAVWACLVSNGLFGQDTPAPDRHENSLSQSFLPIPGTAVLFATTETRVRDFKAFVDASKHAWSFKPHFAQADDHPVVGVNLQDALAFCNWLTTTERSTGKINATQTYRLPTSTEWSAAAGIARARKPGAELTAEETLSDQRRFPWGTTWPPPVNSANLAENNIPGFTDPDIFTAPVGKTPASPDGLFDLAGNAWEWTWESNLSTSPKGQLRGGSWAYFNEECLRSSYIYEVPADLRSATIGFRPVFEDRQRTVRLAEVAKKQSEDSLKERREEMIQAAKVSATPDEIAAMRQRLAGDPLAQEPAIDPSKLKPVAPGKAHTNTVGMILLPLPGGRTLLADSEVSSRQYQAFLDATKKPWPDKPSHITSPDHPAASVTWHDAVAYCQWLTEKERAAGLIPATASYRLPGDQEWSTAAGLDSEKGSDPAQRDAQNTDHFPWLGAKDWPPPPRSVNLDAPKIKNYDDPHAYTCTVKSNEPNERGFYELGGNVAEWCAEKWPALTGERVIRGGSWLSSDRDDLLTSRRHHAPEQAARANIGFRCALELPPTAP